MIGMVVNIIYGCKKKKVMQKNKGVAKYEH